MLGLGEGDVNGQPTSWDMQLMRGWFELFLENWSFNDNLTRFI